MTAPVKSTMKLADLPEDEYQGVVRPPIPRLSNDFIPQDTEVALEVGKSVVNVESGEHSQDVCIPGWEKGIRVMERAAGSVEQVAGSLE